MINRQQLRSDCGIVALYNTLECLGYKVKYEELLEYSKKYLNFNYDGMYVEDIKKGLDLLGIKYRSKKNHKRKDLENNLDKGNIVILCYRWYDSRTNTNGGHYVLVDQHTDKMIRAWNASRDNKTPWITKSHISEYIKYSNRHHRNEYTKAIIIPKEQ